MRKDEGEEKKEHLFFTFSFDRWHMLLSSLLLIVWEHRRDPFSFISIVVSVPIAPIPSRLSRIEYEREREHDDDGDAYCSASSSSMKKFERWILSFFFRDFERLGISLIILVRLVDRGETREGERHYLPVH